MKKEEILEASRKENKNKDLAELQVVYLAFSHAYRVGAIACCVILVLASIISRVVLYSPWVIYFSMMGTNWLVRAIKLEKKTDWLLAGMFMIIALLALIGVIFRLLEVSV